MMANTNNGMKIGRYFGISDREVMDRQENNKISACKPTRDIPTDRKTADKKVENPTLGSAYV
jgi:hypothetical protein